MVGAAAQVAFDSVTFEQISGVAVGHGVGVATDLNTKAKPQQPTSCVVTKGAASDRRCSCFNHSL